MLTAGTTVSTGTAIPPHGYRRHAQLRAEFIGDSGTMKVVYAQG